jgi:hypothetical protein
MMVQPGPTIGQVFDEFAKNDYLSLIYHNSTPGGKKISKLERRIIRFATILFFIWIALYAYPFVKEYFYPTPEGQRVELLSDVEES